MIPYRVMFTRLPLAIPSDCFSKNQRSDISLDSLDLLGTSIRKVCFFCDELYGNFLCGIVKRRGFHPSNVLPMENPHPHFSLCAMEKKQGMFIYITSTGSLSAALRPLQLSQRFQRGAGGGCSGVCLWCV